MKIKVIKKDGTTENFKQHKILSAIQKSADKICFKLANEDKLKVLDYVKKSLELRGSEQVTVYDLHALVEGALREIVPKVGECYGNYRDNKNNLAISWNSVLAEETDLRLYGDNTNANTISDLIPVNRSLSNKIYTKKMYQNWSLSIEEKDSIKKGLYYIHDIADRYWARQGIINCCLADVGNIMKNGFELCGVKYSEPKSLTTAFNVFMLITQSMAACQYGGFTVESVDEIFGYYAEKSYNNYINEYKETIKPFINTLNTETVESNADAYAIEKVIKDLRQGLQNITYTLATSVSSRGDFPFCTHTFGLGKKRFEVLTSKIILEDRINGMGPAKVPAMFPKLVLLYDKNLHSKGKELYPLYQQAIECQSQTMLPDMLSLTGDGYVPDMYKKYGVTISPMGCRAFLSPWYEEGGKNPLNDRDKAIFRGRGNLGAISLNLPMIYLESQRNLPPDIKFEKFFYMNLKKVLQDITKIHIKTFEETAKAKAKGNPLGFTQGGFLGGNLNPNDTIREVIKSFTLSFGYTALNELQYLHNGESLYQATQNNSEESFALQVLKYLINYKDKLNTTTEYNWAVYSTPAESLCSTQCKQLEKRYLKEDSEDIIIDPIIKERLENIVNKGYLNNSFHMAVTEDISPIQKQEAEYEFFHLATGGRIQYCRVPNASNLEANEALMDRSMRFGYYAGLNINADFCEDCGHRWYPENGADPTIECPQCGSLNVLEYNRICGYLGISKASGGGRIHEGKLKDIRDRKSM